MKTHLLTKKRALISSVAMLLVAIIALGTATFAWFTKASVATAQGINVNTIKASELQIKSLHKDWTDTLDYGSGQKILKPASTYDATNWFKADAIKKEEYLADDKDITPVTDDEKEFYYYQERLDIRNNGTAAVKDVKVKVELDSNSINKNYLRVALVPCDASGNVSEDFALSNKTVCSVAGAEYAAIKSKTGNVVAKEKVTPSATWTFDAAARLAGRTGAGTTESPYNYDSKTFKLFVWFEGQDQNCYDAYAGAEIPNITFRVTGTTVDQQTGN